MFVPRIAVAWYSDRTKRTIAAREPHGRAAFFCGQVTEPARRNPGRADEDFRGTDLAAQTLHSLNREIHPTSG
jgi:hypothetical protein